MDQGEERDDPEDEGGRVIPLRERHRRRRLDDRWHVDKGIPITWIFALLLAAAGQAAMFWVAMHDLQGTVAAIVVRLDRFEGAQYTRSDALRDWQAARDRDADRDRRIAALEARVDAALSGGIHVHENIREVPPR